MPKKRTPSFITEVPLKVDSSQESELLSKFEAARQLYNACLGEAMTRMKLVRDSEAFKIAKKISRTNKKECSNAFSVARQAYRYSDFDIQSFSPLCQVSNVWEKANISKDSRRLCMTFTQISAQDLFRAAYENRYTWDKNFPGYTADITYKLDGRVFTGKVQVNSNIKAEVFEVDDEEAKQAINNQLWEIAVHRIRRSFEETHGANSFRYGATDETGAVEIFIGGKSEGDGYKLRNNEVCLVHRHIHGTVVTVNTSSSHDTGEGYLSHRYNSVYHDPKTGEQKGGRSEFEDEYEKVGDYFILNRRLIRTETEGKQSTQELIFSNIKLGV